MRALRVFILVLLLLTVGCGTPFGSDAASSGVLGQLVTRPGAVPPPGCVSSGLAGVPVALADTEGEVVLTGVTDKDGKFLFRIHAGDYEIRSGVGTSCLRIIPERLHVNSGTYTEVNPFAQYFGR